jgi:hypothetical protein
LISAAPPSLGLPSFSIADFADKVEAGQVGFHELLFAVTQLSRLTDGKVPSNLRKGGFLREESQLWASSRSNSPEQIRSRLVTALRSLTEHAEEIPPSNVTVHQFNPALIPIIIQIIQTIFEMLSKFKTT